jgi:hypothetical protein
MDDFVQTLSKDDDVTWPCFLSPCLCLCPMIRKDGISGYCIAERTAGSW